MDPVKFISLRIQEWTISIQAAEKELQEMRKQRWSLIQMYANLTEIKNFNAIAVTSQPDQQPSAAVGAALQAAPTREVEVTNNHHQQGHHMFIEKEEDLDDEEETQVDVFEPGLIPAASPTTVQSCALQSTETNDGNEIEVVKVESMGDKNKNHHDRTMDYESTESEVDIELVYLSPEEQSVAIASPSTSQHEMTNKSSVKKRTTTQSLDSVCSTGNSCERKKWTFLAMNPETQSTIKKIVCHECKDETYEGQELWSTCTRCFEKYVSPGCHHPGKIYVCSDCRSDKGRRDQN